MREVVQELRLAAHAAPQEIGARRGDAWASSMPLFSGPSLVFRPVVTHVANPHGRER
jgi:hypothetical protein